jgi:RNA polymerase sigma factor (sigma-70 family)
LNLNASEDEVLAREAVAGERKAFVELLTRNKPLVRKLCARFEANRWEAEDLEQEIWLEAWLSINRIEKPSRFSAWLQGLALNVGRRWQRRNRRRLTPRTATSDLNPTIGSLSQPAAAAHMNVLERLTERERQLIRLKYDMRLTYVEIAGELNASVLAVRSGLFRARRKLGDQAEPERRKSMKSEAEITNLEIITSEGQGGARRVSGVAKLRDSLTDKHIGMVWDEAAVRLAAEALAEQNPKRPMTHDLTQSLLDAVGARTREVEISRLTDEIYFATVRVESETGLVEVDARPSDALNLAIRAGAPIHISAEVIDAVGKSVDEFDDDLKSYQWGDEKFQRIDTERLWPLGAGS